MQIRRAAIILITGLSLLLPTLLCAQSSSSINTFSPYSLYGIGELSTQGTAKFRAMGGTGVAYRSSRQLNPYTVAINSLNPASYSAIPRKSFIFNFELEGGGHYLSDANTKSSHNSFNIRDISIMFPLANKIGFVVSVAPYSSVGYKMGEVITDPNIVGNIGHVTSVHEGDGDITQIKAGVGMEIFKNFSLGVEGIYYVGYIDRKQLLMIEPIIGEGGFMSSYGSMSQDVSKIFLNLGMQYSYPISNRKIFTVGATYRMGARLGVKESFDVPANDSEGNSVFFSKIKSKLSLPDMYTVGVSYNTQKLGVGLDYSFANWGGKNSRLNTKEAKYRDTHRMSLGAEYTPNFLDVRNIMKRLTYRMGLRYSENYLMFSGTGGKYKKIAEKAISVGVGIPVKLASATHINIGLEFGEMGTTKGGLVRSRFFKVSVGLNLFGEDYWFMKQKYD